MGAQTVSYHATRALGALDMDALRPFQASPADPWDERKAAHLARRAGFGATPAERAQLSALGMQAAVARFVDFPAVDQGLEERLRAVGPALDISDIPRGAYGEEVSSRVRRAWIFRMVHGAAPLQEKLALLWHDHFACQISKVVRVRLMRNQNELFRRAGAGSFRALVKAVARDPAMLVYLDNRVSVRANPNENWARELMELFTLGVDRYGQEDVRAVARAFTGWTTEAPDSDAFEFEPKTHDGADKTLFGETLRGRQDRAGLEEGDEALDRLLARPDCAPFIAAHLLAWFGDEAPAPEIVAALAQRLRATDWSIRETLRALFSSAWFYAEERRFARIRNPVELLIGNARLLEVQNAHLAGLEMHLGSLGMNLFEPPSVAGWDQGEVWIEPGSVAPRFNLALALSELPHAGRAITGRTSIDLDQLSEGREEDAPALVRALANRLLGRALAAEQEQTIVAYLETETPLLPPGAGGGDDAKRARDLRRARVRAALHLVLCAPQIVFA
jgi:uncharacterized protein (DUF1800 family)